MFKETSTNIQLNKLFPFQKNIQHKLPDFTYV